jgi:YidC/Oxa1 family membrane protein insertase
MQIWYLWTDSLTHLLSLIGNQFGVSQACAIICLTMLARVAMMPVSLGAALRTQRNRRKAEQIKPELEKLRERYRDAPQELAKATMQLYRQHGIGFMDRLTLLNIGTQAGFGLGILQVLRSTPLASPFLWIANIARPDFLLTLLVCVLMSAGMMLAPETSAQSSSLVAMIVVSCIVTLITLSAMSSAVGIYWATSNVFSIGQSMILRTILRRRRVMTAS